MATTHKDIGIIEKTVVKKTYDEAQIEWRIPDFSTIAETKDVYTCYDSPAFSMNNSSLFLRLYPVSFEYNEFMNLLIKTDDRRGYSLEYNYSLKKSNSSTEYLSSGILEGNKTMMCNPKLIKRSDILQRKPELTPQNVLTIMCTIKREITPSTQSTASDKLMPVMFISLDALSENFKDLFCDKETCDTTLNVMDKEYKTHRSVLIARSSVFAATFKHDTLERQTGIITITDCDPDSFDVFLKFLYCGRLEEISPIIALNLYNTSDKYDVQELKAFCIEYLLKNVTEENMCEIAVFADKYDETALFSAVQNFFNENVRKIFVTSKWKCFLKEDNHLASKLLIEMSNVKHKD